MEQLNVHLLPTPVEKTKNTFKRNYPFPIIRCNANSISDGEPDPKWKCVEGYLQEECVLIRDEESIKLLYNQGFFGKGTLSKNAPKICFNNENKKEEEFLKLNENQSGTPTSNMEEDDIVEIVDEVDDHEEERRKQQSKRMKREEEEIEVVLSDSNSESEEANLSKKNKSSMRETSEEKECLQLTLEEAYFLSYGLGCLVVKDNKNEPLDLARLWTKFCDSRQDENFPIMYTAYHHFRSKGWIVKPGLKYGVDYVLYKDGPPFYHATYSVIVKPVKEQNLRDARNSRQLTWSSLFALNRLNSGTSKGLLFLYVIKPTSMSENKISTPFCLSQFKVEEVLFQRWVPAEHREEKVD